MSKALNDLIDVLREDNQRLTTKLSLERQLSDCLAIFREKSMVLINNCKCNQNIEIFHDLIKFEKRYHSLKNTQNVDTNEINDKSDVNSTKTSDETNQVITKVKTPPIGQLCSAGSAQPILQVINREQTSGQMFASHLSENTDDIIESNVVSIDLNNTESVEQNTYPIVSDRDGDEEPAPQPMDTGVDMRDTSSTHEIIDILDDSDSEDTTSATPSPQRLTEMVETVVSAARQQMITIGGAVATRGRYVCPISTCGRRPSSTDELKAHVRDVHPGVRLHVVSSLNFYRCPTDGCGKEFVSDKYLNQHIDRFHSMTGVGPPAPPPQPLRVVASKLFPCPVESCSSRGYSLLRNLKTHIRKCHSSGSQVRPTLSSTSTWSVAGR